jgi:hypothetical protein
MNLLELATFILVTVLILAQAAIFLKFRGLYQEFRDFITPRGEEKSPLGSVIDKVIDDASEKISVKAKTTLMGMLSGQSRAEDAVQGELITSGNPILGALAQFPKLRRFITKNPELAQMALSKLSGNHGPAGPQTSGSKWTGNFGG